MAKLYDKKVILQKIETTEGTDAAPVVGTDAILTRNYAPNFLESDTRVRPLDLPFFGARPEVPINLRRGATFEIDMAGAGGAATVVPAWMKMNRIAGFDVGVAGASSVVQTPISTGIPSATHWAYIDNLLMPTVGARATMGVRITDDDFPFFTYTLLGRAPTTLATEATPGAATLTAWKDPILASTENTTFILDGYALPLRSMELDANIDLTYRSLIGPQDRVVWRNRRWAGRIVAELPDLATKNYFQLARTGATIVLDFAHGTVTGNIVEIDAPKVQVRGIDISEEDGVVMMTMDVILQPNVGNDEIIFTSK